jgi:hypothetical protein
MKTYWVESKNRLPEKNHFSSKRLVCLTLLAAFLWPQFTTAAITPDNPPGWFVNMGSFALSAHGTFSCEKCHGDMKQNGKLHPDSENPAFLKDNALRQYDYQRCESCHKPAYQQYLQGAHAKALLKERNAPAAANKLPDPKKAPTCGNCHSSHYVKGHLSKVEIGRQMVLTCGACHPAQAATYLENYHGKAAVNLGNKNAAFCTDCHGAHHCRSLKDHKETLAACKRCHPDATAGFAQVVIHPTTQDLPQDNPQKKAHVTLIRVVTLLMSILVLLVVGFFYGHSFIWVLRELHEKLRRHKS